ncbi:MAG: hypothetical protein Q7U04_09010 [Bacteriovorax sp.]|nr:hypothetical protein [Bacteriovorax sp.]
MKMIIAFSFLISTVAFAQPKLFSGQVCMTANIRCAADSQLITDQNGRCGCLKKIDYLAANECLTALINCDENRNETFSVLQDLTGESIGCGCFTTTEL